MKTIYNKTIIAAIALLSAASCQGLQDITTPDTTGDDAREIKFKSLSVPMAAGQQSVVSAGLFAGDPINMNNVRLDINASGQVTPQTPVMWAPGQEKSTDFLAYSPYDETYSFRSKVKFAVKADQSTVEASAASDLLVAQALSKPADGAVALNFEHKLSQISVYFDNKTGKDITKLTFASIVDCVTLDLENGNVTADSSTSDIVAYNDADRKCYSVIVPAGTFALDLKITLSDGTVLSRKTDELSFAEGKSYDNANEPLVLEDVVVESINVNLSVSDWTYGGNVSFDEYECTMDISVSDITHKSARIILTPTDEDAYYLKARYEKAIFEQNFASDGEFISYLLGYYYDTYGSTYSEYGFSSYEELVLKGLARRGKSIENPTYLTPETEYIQVCFFIDKNINPIYGLTKKEFKTAARPVSVGDYYEYLGTWTITAYNKDTQSDELFYLNITEKEIDKTYLVDVNGFVGGDGWCADYIPAADGKPSYLSLDNFTVTADGYVYSTSDITNIGMALVAFDKADTEIHNVTYTLSDSNTKLNLVSPTGTYVRYSMYGYVETSDSPVARFAYYYDIPKNAVFTKDTAASANKVQHSVFEMPKLLKKQTFKAHKAIR